MEDATLKTPSHIHTRLPRHPFSVISRSDRGALQAEGLTLPDSRHLSAKSQFCSGRGRWRECEVPAEPLWPCLEQARPLCWIAAALTRRLGGSIALPGCVACAGAKAQATEGQRGTCRGHDGRRLKGNAPAEYSPDSQVHDSTAPEFVVHLLCDFSKQHLSDRFFSSPLGAAL